VTPGCQLTLPALGAGVQSRGGADANPPPGAEERAELEIRCQPFPGCPPTTWKHSRDHGGTLNKSKGRHEEAFVIINSVALVLTLNLPALLRYLNYL
jgi:hypothetical protein